MTLVALHREMDVRDGTEDFVHLSNLRFVLQIQRSVEVRNLPNQTPCHGSHHLVG